MPKGDAENLRADLDDGYAKVANLLVEMLACAPLSASELRTVMFVIRRTYGWAKKQNRDTGKLDILTAKDVATGTGLTIRTAEKALGSLVKQCVLTQHQLEPRPGAQCAYGINTNLAEWGSGYEWAEARVNRREAWERDAYTTQKQVLSLPENRYHEYPKTGTMNTQKSVLGQATNPTATGAEVGPTDSITDSITEEGKKEDDFPPLDTSKQAQPNATPPAPLPLSNERGRKRPDGPMLLQNHACLATTVRRVYGAHWSQAVQDDFVCDAGAAIDEPGCTITEDDAIAALEGDGKPTPGRRGDWWIGDLCKAKTAREHQSRASPANGRNVNAPASEADFAAALAEQRAKLGEEVDSGPVDDPFADIPRKRRGA